MELSEILGYVVIGSGGACIIFLLLSLLRVTNKQLREVEKIRKERELAASALRKAEELAHQQGL